TWTMTSASAPALGARAGAVIRSTSLIETLSQRVLRLGQMVEAAPHEAVHEDDVEAHDYHADEDIGKIALRRRLDDVGPETVGDQRVMPVGDALGHDRRVPRPAGGRDATSDKCGEDPGQDELAPLLLPRHLELVHELPEIGRDGAGAGDGVEQDVPLGAE